MNNPKHATKLHRQTGEARKLNVRLLRRIQRHITEEPRRFFMDSFRFHADSPEEWEIYGQTYTDLSKTMPPCGTAACIAGWANLLTGEFQGSNVKRATKQLRIKNSSSLFIATDWPQPFATRYKRAKTPKQRAKIACDRIDFLIKTGR